MPEKVDPPQIEPAVQFSEQLRPITAGVLGSAPITDAVATDDQYLRCRPPFEDFGQSAHEDVEPAIGFEIAGAEGHNLIRAGQAAAVAEPEPGRRIRPHQLGVDTLMHDGDAVAMALRIL